MTLVKARAVLVRMVETHRLQAAARGHLAQPGDTVHVKSGNGLILVLHKSEGLKGEVGPLGHAVQLHPRLSIASAPGVKRTRV